MADADTIKSRKEVITLEVEDKGGSESSNAYNGNQKGGWRLATLLLVNQGLATLAFFGVGVNLVLFFARVLGQENAVAANNISKWTGTVYLCSLIGAFLSDSYLGRYLSCMFCQIIFLLGIILLSLTSWIYLLKPDGCGDRETDCIHPSSIGVFLFYSSIYLIAFGYGGYQPTVATLGSDQFEGNEESIGAFFSYFYFALNFGSLFSNTILVYYEDSGKWTLGFAASAVSAMLALVLFLFGTRWYVKTKPVGNPLPRVAQVFVASWRKWKVAPVEPSELYEVDGEESAIRGSKKINHSSDFQCLDKAAIVLSESEWKKDPWRVCTVTQVEEVKCVLRMLPIWLCSIIYSVIFTQMSTLFVEQGALMDSYIGSFRIPPASMSAFDITSVLVCTGVYRYIVVPIAKKASGYPKGLTTLQRMGAGLVVGLLAMVAAGVTEVVRLRRVETEGDSLSIFWQVPQYVLVGASEVLMYVGQLEFFNGQAPYGLKSLGSSLCMASMSLGNYVSSIMISAVMSVTARDGSPGWIPENLNSGHIDRFFFLIAILAAVDFAVYLFCASRFKYCNLEAEALDQQPEDTV